MEVNEVLIALHIDKDAISRHAEQKAANDIASEIKKQFLQTEWLDGYGFNHTTHVTAKGKELLGGLMKDFVAEYKNEIMEAVVDEVVEAVKRSKTYRDALARLKAIADNDPHDE